VPRKLFIKNKIKTKILPPKNIFFPEKPKNLAKGLFRYGKTSSMFKSILDAVGINST